MNPLETLVGLLYPHNCAICAQSLPEEDLGWLCEKHLQSAKQIQSPYCRRCGGPVWGEITHEFECARCAGMTFHFETAVCACLASGIVRDCIHSFKYQKQLYLGQPLAHWLGEAAATRVPWQEVDAIVPVPLHARREREREFNQAQIIAEHLGKRFERPVWSRSLRRIRDTPTQTRLTRQEREANVFGAFAVKHPESLKGRNLALVDDVFTTGATTSECARVLKEAGAIRVIVLAVAHG